MPPRFIVISRFGAEANSSNDSHWWFLQESGIFTEIAKHQFTLKQRTGQRDIAVTLRKRAWCTSHYVDATFVFLPENFRSVRATKISRCLPPIDHAHLSISVYATSTTTTSATTNTTSSYSSNGVLPTHYLILPPVFFLQSLLLSCRCAPVWTPLHSLK